MELSGRGAKIFATHHPLAVPRNYEKYRAIGSEKELKHWSSPKPDIFLSGHSHRSSVMLKMVGDKENPYTSIFIQAGTVSDRLRGEEMSFNLIKAAGKRITVNIFVYDGTGFSSIIDAKFSKKKIGWIWGNQTKAF